MPQPSSLASTLPAEILTHILRLAQEGEPVPEQFNTRLRFERVCKNWYKSDFKWRTVAVNGVDNIAKLVEMLEELSALTALENLRLVAAGEDVVEEVASRIKTLHVTVPDRAKVDGSSTVASLLDKVTDLESLALVEDHRVELVGPADCLGDAVLLALGALTKMKHFTIAVLPFEDDPSYKGCPTPSNELYTYVGNWSQLETITFTHCDLIADAMGTECIVTASFRSLVLDRSDVQEDRHLSESLVSVLPRHTRALTINSRQWPQAEPLRTPAETGPATLKLARQIEELTITDEPDCSQADRLAPGSERGHFDEFIADFDNLTRLTVTPLAVSDFSSLAHFNKLKELTIVLGCGMLQLALGSAELVRLLENARSLSRVLLLNELTQNWSAREKRDVEEAAHGRMELSWV